MMPNSIDLSISRPRSSSWSAALLLSVLLPTAPVAAQAAWSTDRDPAARFDAVTVHDPVRGVTVLYGGTTTHAWHDTWEWNGSAWHEVVPVVSPQLDVVYDGTFDPVHQRVVIVGSPQPAMPLQVWSYDGVQWAQLPSPSPTPVVSATAAFDTLRGWLVINAGFQSQNYAFWRWNGSFWATAQGIGSPNKMAFDPVHGVTVMTWGSYTITHNGTNWSLLSSLPPNPQSHQMLWDARRQRIVMVGSVYGGTTTQLWLWDGVSWTLDPIALPRARTRFAVCFDAAANGLLVTGGTTRADLDIVDPGTWAETAGGFVWRDAPTNAPVAGVRPGLVHDAARDRIVVFGGSPIARSIFGTTTIVPTNRHFEWDRGTGWSERAFATKPAARYRHGMVYDHARAQTVVFGGIDVAVFGDTWTFDGAAWTQRSPLTSPSPRADAAMCFDPARQVVVLYGGRDLASVLRDTWEWNGVQWAQRVQSYPPADEHAALAYDPRRQRSVLVTSGAPGPINTWLWDGANWQSQTPPAVRPDLAALDLVYDDARSRLVLIGRGAGGLEAWDELAGIWSLRAQDAGRDRDGTAVYDPVAARVVFLGGKSAAGIAVADVDAFAPATPARFDAFGAGCAAAAGVPELTASGLPWLGDTIELRVEPVAPAALAWIDLGFSDTSWLGTPLPYDLAASGAPGCWLLASAEIGVLAGGAPQARRTFALALPNASALAGFVWHAQAVVFDPAGGTLRTSAGRHAQIGSR